MTNKTLTKIVGAGAIALTLDCVISPLFTGKTIHEHLGLPPASDYKVFQDHTALAVERALFGANMIYYTYLKKGKFGIYKDL